MSRADVDAFLAECDDVLDDWEGSTDSASWAADGSHEVEALSGESYYYDYAEEGGTFDPALWQALNAAFERAVSDFSRSFGSISVTFTTAARGFTNMLTGFDEWLAPTPEPAPDWDWGWVLPPEMWERCRVQPLPVPLPGVPVALPDSVVRHVLARAEPGEQVVPDATPSRVAAGLEAQRSPYHPRERRRGR